MRPSVPPSSSHTLEDFFYRGLRYLLRNPKLFTPLGTQRLRDGRLRVDILGAAVFCDLNNADGLRPEHLEFHKTRISAFLSDELRQDLLDLGREVRTLREALKGAEAIFEKHTTELQRVPREDFKYH